MLWENKALVFLPVDHHLHINEHLWCTAEEHRFREIYSFLSLWYVRLSALSVICIDVLFIFGGHTMKHRNMDYRQVEKIKISVKGSTLLHPCNLLKL